MFCAKMVRPPAASSAPPMAQRIPRRRQRDEPRGGRIGADAACRQRVLAGSGQPQAKPRAAEQHPHAPDDEGHHQHEDRERAVSAEGVAQPGHAEGRGHGGEAPEKGLYGQGRPADPEARETQACDDRVGTQLLDHEPEQHGGGDAEHAGDADSGRERTGQHDAENCRAGADDHHAFEAEVPDAGALGDDARHGDVDQRRARAQDRHHELVELGHVGSLAAAGGGPTAPTSQ